jgi:hypothetical protein
MVFYRKSEIFRWWISFIRADLMNCLKRLSSIVASPVIPFLSARFATPRRKTKIYLVWLILANVSGLSRGQTIFDDGGTHTVNGPSGPIEIFQSTTLNVVSPANVTSQIQNGIFVGDSSSTLNLSGGLISGTSVGFGVQSFGLFTATGGSVSGGVALNLLGGTARISGGTFQGSIALGTGGIDNLAISGGTFNGQSAALALNLSSNFHSTVTITGGVFTAVPAQPGEHFVSLDDASTGVSSTVNISGGIFNGPMLLILENGSTVNFFGSDLSFDSSTGQLTGILADGDPLNVMMDFDHNNTPFTISPDGDAITFGPGINGIPEPRSIVLMASGTLLILAWPIFRARSRTPRSPAGLSPRDRVQFPDDAHRRRPYGR